MAVLAPAADCYIMTKTIAAMAISIVLLVLITPSSVFNAYAQQQGGSATSGAAAGGVATAGGVTISGGNCNQCTITNAPQATGGAAASGAAIGGAASGSELTSIATLVDKGNALIDLGMYTQAIQYYDKALAIDPKNKDILYNKGRALEGQRNYVEAIQYYYKALAIDPNYRHALLGLEGVYFTQGNYAQAVHFLDEILAIDPNDKLVLVIKGIALELQGNYAEALQSYDKALAIDPTFKKALVAKQELYVLARAKAGGSPSCYNGSTCNFYAGSAKSGPAISGPAIGTQDMGGPSNENSLGNMGPHDRTPQPSPGGTNGTAAAPIGLSPQQQNRFLCLALNHFEKAKC